MAFLQYIKGESSRTLKLLGLPIYQIKGTHRSSERIQTFLGGLVSTFRLNDNLFNKVEKAIKICGLPLFNRIEESQYVRWYFCGVLFKTIDLKKQFIQKYENVFGKEHDIVFILSSNSGEAYIFLSHVFDAYVRKNNFKRPLIVATKKYHEDMIKAICPDVEYIRIKALKHQFKDDVLVNGKQTYFMTFSHQHFLQVLKDGKTLPIEHSHYYTPILKRCGINENEISRRKITVSESVYQSMLKKVGEIGLDLNKFVFIAPEALSAIALPNKFWVDLINEFKNRGYDAFVNLMGNEVDLTGCEYKSCFLTYPEVFALCCNAKKIISLRSGLTEFLLQTNVASDVLYTKFHDRELTVESGYKTFSLRKLPFAERSNVIEYYVNNDNMNAVKAQILGA
ncbi:hypothetical protein IKU74_05085 [bacterium]|nr:hypothetical protein [bacterium]